MEKNESTGSAVWKQRRKPGFERLINDPAALLTEAEKYFKWCDDNPLYRFEPVKYKGSASTLSVPLGRPYTMDGLTLFLGVSGSYFRTLKGTLKKLIESGKADDNEIALSDTIERIETICRTQNVEGASVGIFSGTLVARIHGIAETVNNHNTGNSTVQIVVRDQKTADHLAELDDLL